MNVSHMAVRADISNDGLSPCTITICRNGSISRDSVPVWKELVGRGPSRDACDAGERGGPLPQRQRFPRFGAGVERPCERKGFWRAYDADVHDDRQNTSGRYSRASLSKQLTYSYRFRSPRRTITRFF